MMLFSFDDDTKVSEGPAAYIYKVEDGANRFLHNTDMYKATQHHIL
jgi:hypothetical protein